MRNTFQFKRKNYFVVFFIVALFLSAFPLYAAPLTSPCRSRVVPRGAPRTPPSTLTEAICLGVGFLGALVPTIIGLGLVTFLWGLTRFISAGGDEKRIQEGKDMMVYGVVGLFVMVSIYTIVSILFTDFFGGLNFGIPLLKTS